MAALFDTSAAVLLLRRRPPAEAEALIRAARDEIAAGGALLPAVAAAELLIGEGTVEGARRLEEKLARIPTAVLPSEAAAAAGSMGAFLRAAGAPIPLPDLLIAATAAWLDLPLLAWDRDYAQARDRAVSSGSTHPGAELWKRFRLHPASLKG